MLRLVLFTLISLALLSTCTAQSDCEKVLREGKRLMAQKKYDDALNQFWAALVTCQNQAGGAQVSDLIRQAQEAYIRDLNQAVEREKKALSEALVAKSQAETAKQKEEIARREAEQNAQRAREQGIRAESRRLALLADNIRSRGQKSDAMLLAYLALRLSGTSNSQPQTSNSQPQTSNSQPQTSNSKLQTFELSAPLMRAFGEAVRDSFGTAVFEGKTPIEQVLPSPDGAMLLVRLSDQSLHRVRLSDRQSLMLVPPGKQPLSAAWSPRSDRLLSWAGDAAPRLWQADGTPLAALEGHTEAVRFAAFSPDGQALVTCSRDNTARLWDASGRLLAVLAGHMGNVYSAVFSPSGKQLVTRSSDGTARVWSRDGGQFLGTVGTAHQYLYDTKPCPAEGRYVTAEADGSVVGWEAEGKLLGPVSRHDGAAREVLFTQKNEVLSRGADKSVRIGKVGAEGASRSLAHPAAVSGFALSPDESQLLTWADDHTVRLWDLASGTLLRQFPGHRGKILNAAFSPDQRYVLSSAKDGLAKLWDTEGNVLTEWFINPDRPLPALFLPDGQHVAVADASNRMVWVSPFPQAVFQKMEAATDLNGPQVGQLARRYNLQFLGEINQ
jgi:WD40 repeat protein